MSLLKFTQDGFKASLSAETWLSPRKKILRTVWGPASMRASMRRLEGKIEAGRHQIDFAFRMEAGRHQIDFAFHNVVKEHESSCGRFATVRYLTRMSTARGFRGDFNSSNN